MLVPEEGQRQYGFWFMWIDACELANAYYEFQALLFVGELRKIREWQPTGVS